MTVLFVGPLPPPVHGFSAMNAAMLKLLQAQTDVVCFDRAPAQGAAVGRPSRWRSLVSTAWQLARFARACFGRSRRSLYLALSGGAGQWVDLVYCGLAAVFGLKIFIHHHSFAYLNARRASAAALFKCARGGQHIVLCPCMGALLVQQYGIEPSQVHVMSNLALLSQPDLPPQAAMPVGSSERPPVRLGFLSNITAEKGIFEFFEVLGELHARGMQLEATIAGPVDAAIADRFAAELERARWVRHIGPVYGAAKWEFLNCIDLLLFPTRYVNEAEPVTILEALQAGVQVVAIDKGCIGSMVSPGSGTTVAPADFNEAVGKYVSLMAQQEAATREKVRKQVADALSAALAAAQAKRRELLFAMGTA